MESVYQESVFAEVELTPRDQLCQQWQQQPGGIPLLRQKNLIDQNAGLLQYVGLVKLPGWSGPQWFAVQGLLIASLIVCFLNFRLTHNTGMLQDQIIELQNNAAEEAKRLDGIIKATQAEIARISHSPKESFKLRLADAPLDRQQALQQLNSSLEESRLSQQQFAEKTERQEHTLRARQFAVALANSGTPFIFSLSLVLCAGGFGMAARRAFQKSRLSGRAGDFYLYFATAEGLWPNLVFCVFLNFALSGSSYGLDGLFRSVGPLFWLLFWAGFYFLVVRFFMVVARSLYTAMEIRQPANEWGLQNKLLVKLHNSFIIVFTAIEGPFLALCYVLYLTQQASA